MIVSDELNHSSIVAGCRASGASHPVLQAQRREGARRSFEEAIAYGRPRTRRPWRKILVMVEGIYSMEGEICDLKNISKVAKKYKAYLSVWKSISVSGAPDNSSLSHFSAMARPCWLRRAVRPACATPSSRRRIDGVEVGAAIQASAVNLISTQVFAPGG